MRVCKILVATAIMAAAGCKPEQPLEPTTPPLPTRISWSFQGVIDITNKGEGRRVYILTDSKTNREYLLFWDYNNSCMVPLDATPNRVER